jgi:hypothetical protein
MSLRRRLTTTSHFRIGETTMTPAIALTIARIEGDEFDGVLT